jgi:hypothetical protein
MRIWPDGPGTKARETKGTAEFTWLAPNKWIQCHQEGSMIGIPIQSTSTIGYDNFKERYVAAYVDSLQTDLRTASGSIANEGKDLVLWGHTDDPMTSEQDKLVKYVYRNFGGDIWTLEVHDMMRDTKTKVCEYQFKRKK